MITILILSIILVVSYTGTTIVRYKSLPDSISAMVYSFPRQWQWVWIVWMWFVAFMVCIPAIEFLADTWKFLGFFTLVCLSFCGAMPLKKHEQNMTHNIFGVSAGILSQLYVALVSPCWLLSWLLFVAVAVYSVCVKSSTVFNGKGVFVMEAVCWFSLTGCLIGKFI